jgi:peptidoglycan biosynthesis protein MviN/MurJ (putative lipid II flippase)
MLTPMIVSVVCVGLNIPLSILLMRYLAQGGIALATVISAMFNNMLMLYLLKKENFAPDMKEVIFTMIRSSCFAAAAVLPAFYYHKISGFCGNFTIKNIPDAVPLLICSLAFLLIYLILSLVVRAPELREIYLIFFSRFKKKKGN